MRLNEEQLSVIKSVRALMAEGEYPPRYICHAIERVLVARVKDESISKDLAWTLKCHLTKGILAGINHMVTFGGFMNVTCPSLHRLIDIPDIYRDTMHMARLAWLDWIIHTGEIKPDFLFGEER